MTKCKYDGLPERTPPDSQEVGSSAVPHLDAAYSYSCLLVQEVDKAETLVFDTYARASRATTAASKVTLLKLVRDRAFALKMYPVLQTKAVSCNLDESDRTVGFVNSWAGLAIEYREALYLRELEDLSYAEIAVITGVRVGTVKRRVLHARINLIEAVQNESSSAERARHEAAEDPVKEQSVQGAGALASLTFVGNK